LDADQGNLVTSDGAARMADTAGLHEALDKHGKGFDKGLSNRDPNFNTMRMRTN